MSRSDIHSDVFRSGGNNRIYFYQKFCHVFHFFCQFKTSAKLHRLMFCVQVQLEEGGVRLALTVVDTPGYGDRLDNTDCWAPALTYLHTQVRQLVI